MLLQVRVRRQIDPLHLLPLATFTTGNFTTGNLTTGNLATGNLTTGNLTTGNLTTGNFTAGNLTTVNLTTGNLTTGITMPLQSCASQPSVLYSASRQGRKIPHHTARLQRRRGPAISDASWPGHLSLTRIHPSQATATSGATAVRATPAGTDSAASDPSPRRPKLTPNSSS